MRLVALLTVFMMLAISCTSHAGEGESESGRKDSDKLVPLPRIAVRSGDPYAEFYNTVTGKKFQPIGSSYVRLYVKKDGTVFHCNFAEGQYDAKRAEKALKKMAESGYNVVRVWLYHGHFGLRPILSVEGPYETDTPELYEPYMKNLLDFIERATRHRVYIQLAIDRTPQNRYYTSMVNEGYPQVEGSINREYMVPDAIVAKEIYIDHIMQALKEHNPALLTTIFAYEIRNEIHTRADQAPFNATLGVVKTAAGEYDMSDPQSRQACQDENVTLYLNRCVDRIKKHDPQALTTSSIFTFAPVKKIGLAGKGLLPVDMEDNRWPVRPSVILASKLDFVDIHNYYPWKWMEGLESSEWESLDKTQKPFMAGEFGAHRTAFSKVEDAAEALFEYRRQILDSGFQGALLFTWDTEEHTRWTMIEDGEVIRERLKPSLIGK